MSSHPTPPAGFSWLSPACRPTPQEIESYATAIAQAEGEFASDELRREAELQLWIWRTENRQAPDGRRAPPRRPMLFPASTH